jgi:hypothetical protein
MTIIDNDGLIYQIKSQMFMIIVGIFRIYVSPSDLVGINKKWRLPLTSNSKMHNT